MTKHGFHKCFNSFKSLGSRIERICIIRTSKQFTNLKLKIIQFNHGPISVSSIETYINKKQTKTK